MVEKINTVGKVDWSALKQLSDQYKDEELFDLYKVYTYDLLLFQKFFNYPCDRKCVMNHHSGKPSSQYSPTDPDR